MRRSSSIASSFLYRSIGTSHGAVSAYAISNQRLLQAALFSSSSHTHRRWFSSLLDSVAGGSARAASLGVVGAVASLAAAVSMSQDVYAKEPLRQELVPKEVVLYQYEACPFCNKVKGDFFLFSCSC